MEQERLLGLPLEEALAVLEAAGERCRVAFTCPPRKQGGLSPDSLPEAGRAAFVVGARAGLLIAAWFSIPNPRSVS